MPVFFVTYPETKYKPYNRVMFWKFAVHYAIKMQDFEKKIFVKLFLALNNLISQGFKNAYSERSLNN